MSFTTNILLGIAMAILAVSLIYTMVLAKSQKALKSELDTKIPHAVQEHAYIRNPVFLTYAIFFALLILTIVFFSGTINW
jgi:NADH:ubiquinone oxidoreductase subunit 6 (subunit J)